MWVVYVLLCCDGTLYTGATNNLQRRIIAHNVGKGAKYTASRRPVILLWNTNCDGKSPALKLEARIKKMSKKQKLEFISQGK